MTLNGERVSGVNRLLGQKLEKQAKAGVGEVVALGRLDGAHTGSLLSPSGKAVDGPWPEPLKPMFALAVHARERSDEVKLTAALARLVDEDTSLSFGHDPDTGEFLLWGQGEMHVSIALDRLRNRFNIQVAGRDRRCPIRRPSAARSASTPGTRSSPADTASSATCTSRSKHCRAAPRSRFPDRISGGVVPKQYIPAVEAGVREYLARGPLGFPVVDFAVTLTDGQYHTVDSSDMAFRKAAQLAMREGMPKCGPVLLEPIFHVEDRRAERVHVARPARWSAAGAARSWVSRQERLAGLGRGVGAAAAVGDARPDHRSALGDARCRHFRLAFDHLQELSGKLADEVVAQRAHAG